MNRWGKQFWTVLLKYTKNRAFRIDVLVENAILVEVKSASGIAAIDETQLVSYLRLADMRLGYLINFNEILLKDGIRRKVNNFFYNKISF